MSLSSHYCQHLSRWVELFCHVSVESLLSAPVTVSGVVLPCQCRVITVSTCHGEWSCSAMSVSSHYCQHLSRWVELFCHVTVESLLSAPVKVSGVVLPCHCRVNTVCTCHSEWSCSAMSVSSHYCQHLSRWVELFCYDSVESLLSAPVTVSGVVLPCHCRVITVSTCHGEWSCSAMSVSSHYCQHLLRWMELFCYDSVESLLLEPVTVSGVVLPCQCRIITVSTCHSEWCWPLNAGVAFLLRASAVMTHSRDWSVLRPQRSRMVRVMTSGAWRQPLQVPVSPFFSFFVVAIDPTAQNRPAVAWTDRKSIEQGRHILVETHTHTHTRLHACTYAHTHTQTTARMYVRRRARAHTHTHTHTHTRAYRRNLRRCEGKYGTAAKLERIFFLTSAISCRGMTQTNRIPSLCVREPVWPSGKALGW